MKIRKAADGDMEAIKEIFREFAAYHTTLDDSFINVPNSEDLFAEYVKSLIARDDATVLVALDNEVVTGYIVGIIQQKPPVYVDPTYGFIDSTAVKEACQRRGTATLLFQTLHRWFEDQGIKRLELHVATRNPKSTAFWRKMGLAPYLATMYVTI